MLLAVPLIRAPESAPPGPGNGVVTASTGVTPVDDVEDVLGGDTWYGVAIVAQGKSLALSAPQPAEDSMRIKLDGNGLSGYDGCHWFNAARALLESAPSNTVALTVTANSCGPDPVGSKEFYDALKSGPKSWVLDRGLLVLTSGSIEISFSKDRTARPPSSATVLSSEQDVVDFIGTSTWYAAAIFTNGQAVDLAKPLSAEQAMRLRIVGNSIEAYDGCGWIGADVSIVTSNSSVPAQLSYAGTECSPPPGGQSEFYAALQEGSKSWSMMGGDLVLRAGIYEVTFDSTPSTQLIVAAPSRQDVARLLGSKTWYVTKILTNSEPIAISRPVDPEQAMRLQLSRTGMQGYDGCNWIGTSAALMSSGAPTTVALSQNGRLCEPTPAGQKEFMVALQARDKWWFVNRGGVVLQAAGYEITFNASALPPSAATSSTG
ncbi:hypothetical protein ABLG96_07750 [Nakamurella sp. A5-74]|uniref:META domain-containing protein n=1 Tax=Nakamurella sp. A5-74 TaxID=3158264 RepID=A0AAU8DSA1_9ACTN